MCTECHKAEEDICAGHLTTSWGRCECCLRVDRCVDCRAYKHLSLPELLERSNRLVATGGGGWGEWLI